MKTKAPASSPQDTTTTERVIKRSRSESSCTEKTKSVSAFITKICTPCQTTKAKKWIKYGDQNQCESCYKKRISAVAKSGESGKICAPCKTTTPRRWYIYNQKENQCGDCYEKAKSILASSGSSGKVCAGCQTITTKHWYKYKEGPYLNQDKCQQCYKAEKKALSNEFKLNSLKDFSDDGFFDT